MGFGRYAEKYALGRSPLDTRGLRLGRWKLTRYSTGEAELYDLLDRPAGAEQPRPRPAYAETLRRMKGLYERYHDCSGAECRAALPSKWRLSRPSRAGSPAPGSATNRYFGN